MQLIDTHVHINFDVFNSDLEEIRKRWQQAGVIHLVHSCVEPQEFLSIKAIADRFQELFYAVGLHPLDAQKWTSTTANQIQEFAKSDPKVVAIGETGLDFYKADNQDQQKFVFEQQLTIAQKLNKPLIIHCRDAANSMANILYDFQQNQGLVKGVMHCWGGTPQETRMFLDLGFYISFSGIVTFKNAIQIQESAKIVPDDRLLVETDCPFIAPVPKRGKRNEPAYVKYVAEKVAELRGVTFESLAAQTSKNASQLFGFSIKS
ncbi:TatD family hydrolase [Dapis sp. BLCC M126]|uniref:TatD family hydrolase n=1 Tax=Dapis sp. BLCC M126 TaxID=3400189 RepID=UPI003CF4E079